MARAYLPRTAKHQDFITELASGIKKEVSVGCAVNRLRCYICGEDLKKGACRHQKGKTYDGRPVSYTHLDVYKRQGNYAAVFYFPVLAKR